MLTHTHTNANTHALTNKGIYVDVIDKAKESDLISSNKMSSILIFKAVITKSYILY